MRYEHTLISVVGRNQSNKYHAIVLVFTGNGQLTIDHDEHDEWSASGW